MSGVGIVYRIQRLAPLLRAERFEDPHLLAGPNKTNTIGRQRRALLPEKVCQLADEPPDRLCRFAIDVWFIESG